ncbi:hypothetical protein Acsp03_42320 [Actinomadura sp. NBRC 104412]|nr:hypothetical protein [Actinomadura sp. NBRC 104412]GLZ06766.1 hypothetical protein Acsp03_42320 [Actinomadura sp. NBRC 104412]
MVTRVDGRRVVTPLSLSVIAITLVVTTVASLAAAARGGRAGSPAEVTET